MKALSKDDLIEKTREQLVSQAYGSRETIDGVVIVELKQFPGEDGAFEEILRFDEQGLSLLFKNFAIRQVNRSKIIPGGIKAWHVHLNQEDVWYVPSDSHVLLGLWDIRRSSPTKDTKMRVVLGGGNSKLVYIPRGVAHGVANFSHQSATLFYFVNQQFDATYPDEYRLSWDSVGKDFWTPEKG